MNRRDAMQSFFAIGAVAVLDPIALVEECAPIAIPDALITPKGFMLETIRMQGGSAKIAIGEHGQPPIFAGMWDGLIVRLDETFTLEFPTPLILPESSRIVLLGEPGVVVVLDGLRMWPEGDIDCVSYWLESRAPGEEVKISFPGSDPRNPTP